MISEILDYVILGLLFLIAINLLLNMINKNGQSTPPQKNQIVNQIPTFANKPIIIVPYDVSTTSGVNPVVSQIDYAPLRNIQGTEQKINTIETMIESINGSANGSENESVNRSANELTNGVQMNGSVPMDDTPLIPIQSFNKVVKDAENKQVIQAYQQYMLEMNENINRSSAGVDVVDKLNQLFTESNNEIVGLNGQTIGQIYDNLTQNIIDKKKKCKYTNCLYPEIDDNLTNTKSYVVETGNGKYFRQGRLYENDSVETGAKFYGNVEADDYKFEDSFVWNQNN